MSVMREEIYEQPQAVAATLEREYAAVSSLAYELRDSGVRNVVIAGRGTSDSGATYAKYVLEIVAGVPVSLAAPSVFTLYDARVQLAGSLVLGISQSGQATDIVQTLSAARVGGARTACVTNVANSPITEVSDVVLLTHAGDERAVAATKTYTTTVALVALLAAQWASCGSLLDALRAAPEQIAKMLQMEEAIIDVVERYRYMEECAVLARGINQSTALEAALKMTETSYVMAKPFSGADFLHGPVAMVSEGFPCFLYAPDGRAYPSMVELAVKLRERGAEMITVARSREILDLAITPLEAPVEVDELLSPLVYIVAGQLWACYLAQARGHNPDRPRGLSKVTLTR